MGFADSAVEVEEGPQGQQERSEPRNGQGQGNLVARGLEHEAAVDAPDAPKDGRVTTSLLLEPDGHVIQEVVPGGVFGVVQKVGEIDFPVLACLDSRDHGPVFFILRIWAERGFKPGTPHVALYASADGVDGNMGTSRRGGPRLADEPACGVEEETPGALPFLREDVQGRLPRREQRHNALDFDDVHGQRQVAHECLFPVHDRGAQPDDRKFHVLHGTQIWHRRVVDLHGLIDLYEILQFPFHFLFSGECPELDFGSFVAWHPPEVFPCVQEQEVLVRVHGVKGYLGIAVPFRRGLTHHVRLNGLGRQVRLAEVQDFIASLDEDLLDFMGLGQGPGMGVPRIGAVQVVGGDAVCGHGHDQHDHSHQGSADQKQQAREAPLLEGLLQVDDRVQDGRIRVAHANSL
jgi:hypothetical protein